MLFLSTGIKENLRIEKGLQCSISNVLSLQAALGAVLILSRSVDNRLNRDSEVSVGVNVTQSVNHCTCSTLLYQFVFLC